METMIKITPFLVTEHTIKYDVWSLDAYDGICIGPNRLEQDRFIITMEKIKYQDMKDGSVFMVIDDDGAYSCEEPSCFLVKDEFCNWYLSQNNELPLGVDKGKYDYVWRVKK